ncbi:TIR domain-containing protein [Stratiformator vulcanicus]|uniref:TIR domain protein n=1 Tax=Stratiformator vulcanicus TaxID=2527980 RepID=A0A517QYF0_9PLAN|nr:TIR domain-containing protein [Stratiformator vulcanicus]QDT36661.1 TIR domain protein [Stratiformator vulcanicus]
MSGFRVRRLRPNQVPVIRDLQAEASYLASCFPRHSVWLDRALNDIAKGKGRIAYGLFRPVWVGDHTSEEIIGCVILTQPSLSETDAVVVKNLIVKELEQEKGNKSAAGKGVAQSTLPYSSAKVAGMTQLLEKCEAFAILRGFRELIVEIPSTENSEIEFYVSHGFSVVGTRPDVYVRGDVIYRLRKTLIESYRGDPHDMESITRWIAKHYFKMRGLPDFSLRSSEIPLDCLGTDALTALDFEIRPADWQSPAKVEPLKARWVICRKYFPNASIIEHELTNSDYDIFEGFDLKLFLTPYVPRSDTFDRIRTSSSTARVFNRVWLELNTGPDTTVRRDAIPIEDISGLLFELHSTSASRLYHAQQNGKELIFPVASGIGRSWWEHGFSDDEPRVLLYHGDGGPSRKDKGPGVWADCRIVGVPNQESYEEILERVSNNETVFSQNDFFYYMNSFHSSYRGLNGEMMAFTVADFRVLSRSFPLEHFASDTFKRTFSGGRISPEELPYIDSELEVSACYVDEDTLNKWSVHASAAALWQPRKYQAFISYRRTDAKRFAERLYRHLRDKFPSEGAFLDSAEISTGEDIREKIEQSIATSNVVVMLLSHDWRGKQSMEKPDRIVSDKDYVHLETKIAVSLARQKKVKVLPYFINDADLNAIGDDLDFLQFLSELNITSLPSEEEIGLDIISRDIEQLVNDEKRVDLLTDDGVE